MKSLIEELLNQSLDSAAAAEIFARPKIQDIQVTRSKDKNHGDFSSNIALILSASLGQSARDLAKILVDHLPKHDKLVKTEVAGPGFINFYISVDDSVQIIKTVLDLGSAFGQNQMGAGTSVLIEYVSANPTGPLHVGHGRSAAFGASLANLLAFAGYTVHREYYINDAGRQMDILAVSVWMRYLAKSGIEIIFPSNAYRGDYVEGIAAKIHASQGPIFSRSWQDIQESLPLDEADGGDKERYIDALIQRAKNLLGEPGFKCFHQEALHYVLEDIRTDLLEFGVDYDHWFSEQSLFDQGDISKAIEALTQAGHTYVLNGALWFRATDFGDEKDRVLVRANGVNTYFASDVAYHWNKIQRGFHQLIDIFGADHHGYVTRIQSAVGALKQDALVLDILLVQFAILYREGTRVQMSTRSGSFVTLRALRQEVGNDAARFFYVMRKPEQHMDFDLDLAKSESSDNPVYYIQYAHARICSVFNQLAERQLNWDPGVGLSQLALLDSPHEMTLVSLLNRYPDLILSAAKNHEPHQIAYFLRELSCALHSYYNAVTLLCEPESLRCARLCLLKAVAEVLRSGLALLGVSSPQSM